MPCCPSLPTPPFRIKVCGVRTVEDVRATASAGGDAVGLNFYPPSVRSLDRSTARELAAEAERLGICAVGLFVNEPPEAIAETAAEVGLRAVQLHGDEAVEDAAQLAADGFAIVRAVRLPCGPLTGDAIDALVAPWAEAGCTVLFDADAGAAYGGRGLRLDWPSLRRWLDSEPATARPFVLAGGLAAETVAEAVAASGAWGVDVASGVEASRGIKSPERISEFARRARGALASSSLPSS
ncbi:phosphoribosylanthranilate isomerase [Candidatus Laterigemmans baculatus]|uniref:phosphoribosylanthranilate isomerase n=1 Tax=Candidatus Laterigemmans baculatus TaxID=2770505 RepID=UPI0013DCD892|nr:phosphoribosylanthranilate isomerase [Candidatus Laterigemmans baculatus]